MQLKIILFLLFLLILAVPCAAQTEIELANQRLDKAIDLLKSKDAEILKWKTLSETQNALIETLKSQKTTPCSIISDNEDLKSREALNELKIAPANLQKFYQKLFMKRFDHGMKVVDHVCGRDSPQSKAWFAKVLDELKTYAPLVALIALRK